MYSKRRLQPAAAFIGGARPAETLRRIQERQAELQATASVNAALGAWQDAKELRAAKKLCFQLFGRAGRLWFWKHKPGVLHVGYYTGDRTAPGSAAIEQRTRGQVVMFEALTYADLFNLVVLWKATRA